MFNTRDADDRGLLLLFLPAHGRGDFFGGVVFGVEDLTGDGLQGDDFSGILVLLAFEVGCA